MQLDQCNHPHEAAKNIKFAATYFSLSTMTCDQGINTHIEEYENYREKIEKKMQKSLLTHKNRLISETAIAPSTKPTNTHPVIVHKQIRSDNEE